MQVWGFFSDVDTRQQKSQVIPVDEMKEQRGEVGKLHEFFNSVLDKGKWLASRQGQIYSGEQRA